MSMNENILKFAAHQFIYIMAGVGEWAPIVTLLDIDTLAGYNLTQCLLSYEDKQNVPHIIFMSKQRIQTIAICY